MDRQHTYRQRDSQRQTSRARQQDSQTSQKTYSQADKKPEGQVRRIPIGGKKDRQSRYTNRKIIRLIAG